MTEQDELCTSSRMITKISQICWYPVKFLNGQNRDDSTAFKIGLGIAERIIGKVLSEQEDDSEVSIGRGIVEGIITIFLLLIVIIGVLIYSTGYSHQQEPLMTSYPGNGNTSERGIHSQDTSLEVSLPISYSLPRVRLCTYECLYDLK